MWLLARPYSVMTMRVVGVAVTPDNVAFPLTNGPRVYVDYDDVRGSSARLPVRSTLCCSGCRTRISST